MKRKPQDSRVCGRNVRFPHYLLAAGLLFSAAAILSAQAANPSLAAQHASAPAAQAQGAASGQAAGPPASSQAEKPSKIPGTGDKRRAAKAFLSSTRLYEKEQFEEAMHGYELAAKLDPSNKDYALAASVARSHAVTALVQAAAKDRLLGNTAAARAALAHALELDPKSFQATEHLHELSDDLLRGQVGPLYQAGADEPGPAPELAPVPGTQSFHLHSDARQIIQQVYKAYGLTASMDDSVRASQIRFDLDDVTFRDAIHALEMVTGTFYVPLDPRRVLVARNTRENRERFQRQQVETVYLPGLSATELSDVGNLAKNVFEVSQSAAEPTAGTLTLRASESSLNAFNAAMFDLLNGRNEVLLDVRMIQLAHNSDRNTGAYLPQQMSVFNVSAEAMSILNSNQSLVQEIVSSGLASAGDYGAILAILLVSGQVSSPLLSGGFAVFGGSCTFTSGTTCSPTAFGLAPGTATLNFTLNSSDSRQLDQIQLRLEDDEAGTLKSGTRYPITTSSYSGLSASVPNIPGLTSAGNSGSLASLLSQASSEVPNVPMVEYQDLGLTLKATPKVLRSGDVALTVDLKITALAGSSLNGVPVLSNDAYSGVATIKEGESVAVFSEVDKQQSRAISGMPGLSEIPGLNDLTGNDTTKNYATLMIVITPHVVRGPRLTGHSPMMRIERTAQTR